MRTSQPVNISEIDNLTADFCVSLFDHIFGHKTEQFFFFRKEQARESRNIPNHICGLHYVHYRRTMWLSALHEGPRNIISNCNMWQIVLLTTSNIYRLA